ncbi:MAG TPA: NfeD family protein [Methylocella sp.]|nr:NfeD family protein [Methylocella sp.]
MDALISDSAQLYLVAGLLLLGIDIFIVGLSPLMFVAAGALATSALLYISGWKGGILHLIGWDLSLVASLAVWALLSLLFALLGRRPLQAFQNAQVCEDESSDLIGREVMTTHEVTKTGGFIDWSGTRWRARLAENAGIERIGPGARVQIIAIKDLALILKPLA